MKVVGVTGGSGCGKSSVCELLKEHGFYIIDADAIARQVVSIGRPAYNEMVLHFGKSVLTENGEIDRRAVANIVFNNKTELEVLSKITHKYVVDEIIIILDRLKKQNMSVAIDVYGLFETNLDSLCDVVVAVWADHDVRLQRIVKRDGLTIEQAKSRINSQQPIDFYIAKGAKILYNNGSMGDVRRHIKKII